MNLLIAKPGVIVLLILLYIADSVVDKYREVDDRPTAAPLPDGLPAGHHLLPRGVREPNRAGVHHQVPEYFTHSQRAVADASYLMS